MSAHDDLLEAINSISLIDLHSRVRPDLSQADNICQVVLCDDVKTELLSANAPSELFDLSNTKKTLDEAVQYFPRIANTTSYWCLAQITRDLFEVGGLAAQTDLEALQKQCESAQNRSEEILAKGNIEKVLFTHEWYRTPPKAIGGFAPILDIWSLVNEAHTSRTLDRLAQVAGQKVYEAADLKKAVIQLFRQAKEAGVVAASVKLEPTTDFEPGDRDAADRILSLVLLGQKVNREDRRALRSYVMDLVLESCHEHRMPIQLLLGSRYLKSSERDIAGYEQSMIEMYCGLFARHSGVKFDVILAGDLMAHEFAVASRQFRNVFLGGFGTFLNIPTRLRNLLRERIELLPMTKCSALASGSACVEWVYGKSKLARRVLAAALADLTSEGYLSRETAMEVARHYLAENPKRIYKLE